MVDALVPRREGDGGASDSSQSRITTSSRSGARLNMMASCRATRSSSTMSVTSTAPNPAIDVARSRARSVSEILFTVLLPARISQGMCPAAPPPISAAIPFSEAPRTGCDVRELRARGEFITIPRDGLQNSSRTARLRLVVRRSCRDPRAAQTLIAPRLGSAPRPAALRGTSVAMSSATHGPTRAGNSQQQAPRTAAQEDDMNALANFIAAIRRDNEGQDLLEYALLVALIAIVAVAVDHVGRRVGGQRHVRGDRDRPSSHAAPGGRPRPLARASGTCAAGERDEHVARSTHTASLKDARGPGPARVLDAGRSHRRRRRGRSLIGRHHHQRGVLANHCCQQRLTHSGRRRHRDGGGRSRDRRADRTHPERAHGGDGAGGADARHPRTH